MKKIYSYDADFIKRHDVFKEEVLNETSIILDEKTRYLGILSVLIGSHSLQMYKQVLKEALGEVLSPTQVKEIVYQSVAYLGMGRAYEFLEATNELMTELGIQLPLDSTQTTTLANRLEEGIQAQVSIFGDGMKEFYRGSQINRWLAENCFGDYYTRQGLDLSERELITFCFLYSLGGCENQLMSHVFGNLRTGNNFDLLTNVIMNNIPYMGYPRSLNAMAIIDQVKEKLKNG